MSRLLSTGMVGLLMAGAVSACGNQNQPGARPAGGPVTDAGPGSPAAGLGGGGGGGALGAFTDGAGAPATPPPPKNN